MPTQYTIRNIPPATDRYYRKRAALSGKSLNQVILDELNEKVSQPTGKIGNSLDWFIGSGMDQETIDAIDEMDRQQKALAAKVLAAEQATEHAA